MKKIILKTLEQRYKSKKYKFDKENNLKNINNLIKIAKENGIDEFEKIIIEMLKIGIITNNEIYYYIDAVLDDIKLKIKQRIKEYKRGEK